MDQIVQFQEEAPSLETYWRSIILFGRNVASYKFALSESLLDLAKEDKTIVSLDDLAIPYAQHLCEHLKTAPKQATSSTSRFLEACKQFNEGMISEDELRATTVSLGFNNVIDAFHNVNGGEIPIRFYEKDYYQKKKKIILTDEVFKMLERPNGEDLYSESESRWNLVETAWELQISRNLLNVHYDDRTKLFFVDESFKRKDVTSARDALNGYQKGKCFYCYTDITVRDGADNSCDVDHFYPHILQPQIPQINLDGIWNLVLACPECNRGANGKFARRPSLKYLERLHKRNEFLINSHHPLRDTIMRQTGTTEQARHDFLQMMNNESMVLGEPWETKERGEATF